MFQTTSQKQSDQLRKHSHSQAGINAFAIDLKKTTHALRVDVAVQLAWSTMKIELKN